MKDYHIEFAHIYADERFGDEQKQSIVCLKKRIAEIKKNKKSYSTSILIDEFNPEKNILNEKEFISILKLYGASPDSVVHESSLASVSRRVIELISSEKINIENFGDSTVMILSANGKRIGLTEKSGKPTCSLLIATWILCRLGYFSLDKFPKQFSAKKIITILPKKYQESEEKMLEILKSTKFSNLVDRLEYIWF